MTKESFSPYSPLDYIKTAEDLEAYVRARIEEYLKDSDEKTSADCPACSVGSPGVYIKDGRMVCPHRPETKS